MDRVEELLNTAKQFLSVAKEEFEEAITKMMLFALETLLKRLGMLLSKQQML